jgi:hypothetical protein
MSSTLQIARDVCLQPTSMSTFLGISFLLSQLAGSIFEKYFKYFD